MIPLDALQTLDAIDRKGSFAAAADELYRVPSAITYTIKKLEEQLGVKLFDRDKQRAVLTPTGKLVLDKGREILNSVHQLEVQAKQSESGCETQLRIVVDTVLPIEHFWPSIAELQQQQPWLNIQILEESLSGSWEALIQDRADLIIGVSGDEPAGGNWKMQALGQIKTVLCCSPAHPAATLPSPIDQQELQHFTHIVVSDSARHLPTRDVSLLGLKQYLRVSTMTQKVSALTHGLGISHLPLHYAQPLFESGTLVPLAHDSKNRQAAFYMCWRRDNTGKANQWLREAISDSIDLDSHSQ